MRLRNVWRKRRKRRVPQLNTVATADISFMLLIFFLVTTSMDSDRVLKRQLPPREPQEEVKPADIDSRLVLTVNITADNRIVIDKTPLTDKEAAARMTEFVQRVGKKHIIEICASNAASYDTYFHLQNTIVNMYRDLRNSTALKRYRKPFNECDYDAQQQIKRDIPQRLSERFVE